MHKVARLNRPGAGELRWSALLGVHGHDMAASPSRGEANSGTPRRSMRLLYAPSSSAPLHQHQVLTWLLDASSCRARAALHSCISTKHVLLHMFLSLPQTCRLRVSLCKC